MQRTKWTFHYQAEEVRAGAEAKVEHHESRYDFWTGERAAILGQIKETGLDVRNYEVTGGSRADVVIDPTLQKRLTECESKVREHSNAIEDYSRWVAVFEGVEGPAVLVAMTR